ncbi:MAG: dethiobiotin synthase [Candidatus Gastranaerophilales bacterium]|nr:dethiobiotin synthase [Candidatus Gastranaerophilales bacterium]
MLNIFITGSDINVGKTFITAGLAATMQSLGYLTCVYKPIQTGALGKDGFMQSPDLLFVKNIDPYIKTYSTYLLKEALIPVIAAENEGININKNAVKKDYEAIIQEHDCTIVESTGGIMTPVGKNLLISDVIKTLDLPAVIVIKPTSGTINQTLLTINHARTKGLKVRGVIINDYPESSSDVNLKTIPRLVEEYSDAKILGVVRHFDDTKKINPNDLITDILNGIDIESVFNVKIAKLDLE